MGNSTLVWWLLGAPLLFAIIDRMRLSGTTSIGARDGRARPVS